MKSIHQKYEICKLFNLQLNNNDITIMKLKIEELINCVF